MIDFVLLSLPIFAVVALGFVAAQTGLMPLAALDTLGAFSFRFALPALVLRQIGGQPLAHSFNPAFFGGYLAAGLLAFGLVLALSLMRNRKDVAGAGARAMSATVSNLGFLGPPLMLAFLGERGAGPLAMAILAEIMVLLSLGGAIMGSSQGDGARMGSVLLRGAALNPIVAAILLGACLAASGAPLPSPLDRLLAFLGSAAGPTALFALGGSLAGRRIDRATTAAAASVTVVKLVVYPLAVWYVLARLIRVEPFWIEAGVLISALPSAGSNCVLAQRYGADADRVSAAIVLSTLASVVTVPLLAWVMLA